MSKKYYYTKQKRIHLRSVIRFTSLFCAVLGIIGILYIFLPLISWNVYFEPAFASSDYASPIPKNTIVTTTTISNLFAQANPLNNVDYSNAQNWFPNATTEESKPPVSSYKLSIPKIGVKDAIVSTVDYDLDKHLINYGGTAIPPEKGTSVVFGHSTLPQLFDPNNYKTIFANAYKLQVGDTILVESNNVVYTYIIYNLSVVEPTDTSVFTGKYDDSYLTIVTCTPPGTTWRRLLIKTKLQTI